LPPPEGYVPIRTPARKLTATPTPMQNMGANAGFRMMATPDRQGVSQSLPDYQPGGNLPLMKPDDLQYFNKLLEDIDDDSLPPEEAKERKIMKLLLKIKNGTPPMRKSALRQITDKAREFGAGPLFNQILPLLMSPSLEDQERHLLVIQTFYFGYIYSNYFNIINENLILKFNKKSIKIFFCCKIKR
jgi:splicing factor 3B subunit 1